MQRSIEGRPMGRRRWLGLRSGFALAVPPLAALGMLSGCGRVAANLVTAMLLPSPYHGPEYVTLECARAAPAAPEGLRVVSNDSFRLDPPSVALTIADARPRGDTLIWESFTEEEEAEDEEETYEVSGSYPVILRRPLDLSLAADLQHLLERNGLEVSRDGSRRLELRLTESSVRIESRFGRRSLIIGEVRAEVDLSDPPEAPAWDRLWSGVDTLHSFSPTTDHYAEAIRNSYCRLLDQAVLSLDSAGWYPH